MAFCSKCGAERGATVTFCPKCGAATAQLGGAAETAASGQPKGWWRNLTRGAGAVLVIAFFLPWVAVSCDAPNLGSLTSTTGSRASASAKPESVSLLQASGLQLAVGPTVDMGITKQHMPSHGGLWLLLLGAIVMVVATFVVLADRTASFTILGCAGIGLLALVQVWQSANDNSQLSMFRVDYKAGLWLTILGLLAAAGSGVFGLRAARAGSVLTGGGQV